MEMIDNVCYEYRGRLSIVEAMNMNVSDLLLLHYFIIKRKEAADAVKQKEDKEASKNKPMNIFQGNLTQKINSPALTRDDYAKLEDALEGMD